MAHSEIKSKKIFKMRTTIRFNKEEEAKLDQLKAITSIDDTGTAVKFAMDWTLNHIKIVTDALIAPNWEVIFRRKSKTYSSNKKVYYE
jgi:hypothetical protein